MNSPDLECDEDPAICDCAFHDNARRAERWHDADPLRCSQCGREPPSHARHCPTLGTELAQRIKDSAPWAATTRVASALAELAGIGSDVCALLHAVQQGAILVITGPDAHRAGSPKFGASLESSDGAREAHAMGEDLPRLLSDLTKCWNSAASMRNRVST